MTLTADKKEGEVTTQLKEVMFAQGRREMADDAGRRVQASGYGNASAGIISVGNAHSRSLKLVSSYTPLCVQTAHAVLVGFHDGAVRVHKHGGSSSSHTVVDSSLTKALRVSIDVLGAQCRERWVRYCLHPHIKAWQGWEVVVRMVMEQVRIEGLGAN